MGRVAAAVVAAIVVTTGCQAPPGALTRTTDRPLAGPSRVWRSAIATDDGSGAVVVADADSVRSIDPATAATRWRELPGGAVTALGWWAGPAGTKPADGWGPWVLVGRGPSVVALDPATGSVRWRARVGGRVVGVVSAGGRIVAVSAAGRVAVLAPGGDELGTVDLEGRAVAVVADTTRSSVWVTQPGERRVTEVDVVGLQTRSSLQPRCRPDGPAAVEPGRDLIVLGCGSGVAVLNLRTGFRWSLVPTPAHPTSIALLPPSNGEPTSRGFVAVTASGDAVTAWFDPSGRARATDGQRIGAGATVVVADPSARRLLTAVGPPWQLRTLVTNEPPLSGT